jgi:hypothetical protein
MLSIPRIRLVIPAVIAAMAALALAVPAVASAASFSLTIDVEPGAEAGTVECEVNGGGVEPCEAEYEEGDEVNLVPEAEEGYEFLEFSGDCGPLACELEMDEDHEVTAVFVLTEPPEIALDVKIGGEGEGEVFCAVAPLGLPEICEAEYPEGTQLTLLAEPEVGSFFEEWAGDCAGAGSETECELEIDGEKAVEAVFGLEPAEFPLIIEETGGGEGTVTCEAEEGPGPCQPEYPAGTVVTLTAEAETGSEFVEWEEGCDNVSGPSGEVCEVELNEERSVAVVFELEGEFSLTITKGGTGSGEVECEVEGGEAEPCEAKYPELTEITLVAKAASGSTFAGFSEGTGSAAGCSTSPCTFTIEANSKVKATFNAKLEFTLKIKKEGTGTGTVTSSPAGINCGATCEAKFEEGKEVTLTATPEGGSTFAGWTGSGCSGTGTCKVTMSAAKEVTATFNPPAKPEFTLTIVKNGTGSGSVTCNGGACAAKYAAGTKVTLAAGAASGSTFAGWSGGGCSGTGSCEVTVNGDTTVTATFNAVSPPPPPVEEGTVKVAGKATVKSGKALLKLTCSGGPCKGQLKLTAKVTQGGKKKKLTIGKASFSLASGATSTLKVKLSGPAKQELAKGKTIKAKVSGTGVVSSTVKLKNAKK